MLEESLTECITILPIARSPVSKDKTEKVGVGPGFLLLSEFVPLLENGSGEEGACLGHGCTGEDESFSYVVNGCERHPPLPRQYFVIRTLHGWQPFLHVSSRDNHLGIRVSGNEFVRKVHTRCIGYSLFGENYCWQKPTIGKKKIRA